MAYLPTWRWLTLAVRPSRSFGRPFARCLAVSILPIALPHNEQPSGPPVPTGPFIDPAKESLPPRAVLLVAPVTTFFILAILCIGLRLWAKRIKKISLRFTDYAIIVAAVFSVGYLSICWLVAEQGGVGFPLVRVAPPQRTLTQKSLVIAWLLQAWANTFVRLSILDFIAQEGRLDCGIRSCVCFATAWRTYNVVHFSTPEARLNFTMTVVEDALWSGLEINLGIINTYLPVMPAALQRIFKIPFLRLISFSTWRPASGSEASGLRPTWMRLGSTKGDKSGSISCKVEYSVDIEANPMGHIPMGNMGSTTKLAENQWPTYNYTATNQYHPSGKPQGLPEQYIQNQYHAQ
ncbi:hypothetical protein F5Y00DRAFT_264728 [Daldinia vernicosa]|uniref:uncharacterized protein n=1 Tax=Daldinia vernicosa TaxID=114800 RepID=UPI0020089C96|nr:uncharacterized protein F5Y00DRAFT_264728 [Daldinia vernicosa]KAI0846347.1 hypothetical protein F5Y00DRAFT_264728 [Daldinia vernicosa]